MSNRVALRVIPCGRYRLRIIVDSKSFGSTELQTGNGQNARATTIVYEINAGLNGGIEFTKAHGGGRVGTGAKGKARVEINIDRMGIRRLAPTRAYPKALTHF